MKRKWEGKAEKNSHIFPSKPDFTKYPKHNIFWEVFQPLFIVPKQTLMSFIYYKRSKKENLQFWRKISKVGAHEVIFAHHAKIWHTLPNFGIPCEIDVFALRNALFSSILLLIALATPFQVCQGVLKCSKARILHVIDLNLPCHSLHKTLPQS